MPFPTRFCDDLMLIPIIRMQSIIPVDIQRLSAKIQRQEGGSYNTWPISLGDNLSRWREWGPIISISIIKRFRYFHTLDYFKVDLHNRNNPLRKNPERTKDNSLPSKRKQFIWHQSVPIKTVCFPLWLILALVKLKLVYKQRWCNFKAINTISGW